jgi:hypothetical protein
MRKSSTQFGRFLAARKISALMTQSTDLLPSGLSGSPQLQYGPITASDDFTLATRCEQNRPYLGKLCMFHGIQITHERCHT